VDKKQSIVDLTDARPAAVLVIDLVKHSNRSTFEIRRIQKILEEVFSEASKLLNIKDIRNKYTGDGYLCAFLGDSSSRVIDFLNAAVPELKRRFIVKDQAFRIGLDFGLIHLRSNSLTNDFEYFDRVGIQAARLESAAQPNQILCTSTVFQIFNSHYPEVFPYEPIAVTTKDRVIDAYEIYPIDYTEIQQAFSDYIYGTVSDASQEMSDKNRNKILIVDDEQDVRSMMELFIADAFPHMQVLTAVDAIDALKHFKADSFAVVITDVVMPGSMDGLELTERLLTLDKNLVVIMMSGFSMSPASRFYEAGGFRFISKPFNLEHMQQTVRLAINGHLPKLFRSLNIIYEKSGDLILELQRISDALHIIYGQAKLDGHIAQSLIRHKVKHTIADFVKSVLPGNNIIQRAELLRVQMETLSRINTVTLKAASSTFPIFLQQYVDDLRKQHTALVLVLNMDSLTAKALDKTDAETILGLVICELIDNAISAVARKGRVVVEVAMLASIQQLKLAVHDDGKGILPGDMSSIFNQGFSTKGAGRGLGLHLVSEAVKRLGGNISYQTIGGACFTVVVPIKSKS
jgi:signal transduction histidine kinase/class 3 adenylate cyclase